MTRFSLINVTSENDKGVSGSWVQDHIGTLETAQQRARQVEAANNNQITVCITEPVPGVNPALAFFQDLKRLG